jgi:hypothetical protein
MSEEGGASQDTDPKPAQQLRLAYPAYLKTRTVGEMDPRIWYVYDCNKDINGPV